MFAGTLLKTAKSSRKLRGVRKEYSIIRFTLISVHSIKLFIDFLMDNQELELIGIIAFANCGTFVCYSI